MRKCERWQRSSTYSTTKSVRVDGIDESCLWNRMHVCVHKRINAARHANGVYSRYMYTWQNAWSDERRYLMKFLTILWTNFLLEGCENLEGPVSHQRNMCFKAFYVCLSTLNLRRAGLEKCPFILIQRADVDYYLPFLNEHRQWYGLRRIDSAVMRVQARVTTSSKLYDHLTRQTRLWLVSSCVVARRRPIHA